MEPAALGTLTPREAVALQRELRRAVALTPLSRAVGKVGGCDVSMNRFAKEGWAGFVTLEYASLAVRSSAAAKEPIPFPYIPGLLSFREIPMLLAAWKKLAQKPDVLIVDGAGIAHPRGLGIASHLGLILGIPTIGCAKSVLTGSYEEPPLEKGAYAFLKDAEGNVIGAALRTKTGVKPVFVSPGHLITLAESIELVFTCTKGYRLPEPTRLAHDFVNRCRTEETGLPA
jgi:deoxyribonuclease V